MLPGRGGLESWYHEALGCIRLILKHGGFMSWLSEPSPGSWCQVHFVAETSEVLSFPEVLGD